MGDLLPVQVHCRFGDSDLHRWGSDPGYLRPLTRIRPPTTRRPSATGIQRSRAGYDSSVSPRR
jgi:hypothetical protein